MLDKKYALPTREQNGTITELGLLAYQIGEKDKVRITSKGVIVTTEDGAPFFFRFAQSVVKGIADGTISQDNLGHLTVYESNYVDDAGEPQIRLVLGFAQGSSVAMDGAEFTKATTKTEIQRVRISLAEALKNAAAGAFAA